MKAKEAVKNWSETETTGERQLPIYQSDQNLREGQFYIDYNLRHLTTYDSSLDDSEPRHSTT